jgi:hypothetical protein
VQLQGLRHGIESDLAKADEIATSAKREKKRLEPLVASRFRTMLELEQVSARQRYAELDAATAREKLKFYETKIVGIERDLFQPTTLVAPRDGVVLAVTVRPGQVVPPAAPMLTIVDLSTPWVRVAAAEQDLQSLALDEPAVIQLSGYGVQLAGRPVSLVPQVDAATHTAELYYDLAPALAELRQNKARLPVVAKDMRANVALPQQVRRDETVVPSEAVVRDAGGAAWIYLEREAEGGRRHYERRRVEVGPLLKEGLVIRPTLAPVDRVVTAGAAGLLSREKP